MASTKPGVAAWAASRKAPTRCRTCHELSEDGREQIRDFLRGVAAGEIQGGIPTLQAYLAEVFDYRRSECALRSHCRACEHELYAQAFGR